jgi:hypothetical protein
MSKNAPAPIEPDSFTSKFGGHTFNPGDPAIAITMGYRSANLRHGKYLGVRYYKSYYSREENPKGSPCVVMEVVKSTRKLCHKETGAFYDYAEENKIPYPAYPSQFRYNTPEYTAAKAKYDQERVEYRAKVDELRKDYEWRDIKYTGRTMLQLNKIYPADIALRDMVI